MMFSKTCIAKDLEHIPNSVRWWKAAVELENPEHVPIFLTRAVECSTSANLVTASLSPTRNIRQCTKALNKPRENIPQDRQIWATAAKLEDANGNIHIG